MQTFNQPKIEFFQSQSQYSASSSLSSSRFVYFVHEVLGQANKIQNSLKAQLTLQYTENVKEKLKLIMNRISILIHYTIPQHLQHIRRMGGKEQNQNNNQIQLKKCLQQAKQIQQNYNKLLSNQITYDQFYRTYAADYQHNFKKQQENKFVYLTNNSRLLKESNSKLQQIQIIQPIQLKHMSNSSTSFYKTNNLSSQYKNQNKWLVQQISELKQKNLQMKNAFEIKFQNLKLSYEKRLKKMINLKNQQKQRNSLSEELESTKKSLIIQIQEKISQIQKRKLVQIEVYFLKKQNEGLKMQIENFKQISNSRLKLQQSASLSMYNHKQQSQKKIRNDQSLIKLLKFQIKNERLKTQVIKSQCKKKVDWELQKDKSYIVEIKKKIQQLEQENDTLKQKNAHLLRQQRKLQQKITQFNQQISLLKQSLTQSRKLSLSKKEDRDRDEPKKYIKKQSISIEQYEGDGLEGFIHFQCMEKQFKYRFKRACLKQKELLYKKDGLQIGVITKISTQKQVQCKMFFTIYLTNYSDNPIKNVNAKIMNYFKIVGNQKIQFLKAGEQKKFLVELLIQSYPIGPALLSLNGMIGQQIRILLPAHIFKLFKFQQSKQKQFLKFTQLKLETQKRIIKNYSCLKELLNVRSNSQSLNLIGTHDHTKTSLILNIKLQKQLIVLRYQHLQGSPKIVQYFIKCFSFLIRKSH